MTDLIQRTFEGAQIRIIQIEDEPWFVLNDVCQVLGIANPWQVAERIDQDALCKTEVIDSMGRAQQSNAINEPGLYEVIIRSNSPKAKPFKDWVLKEVLPSIRKTGSYAVAELSEIEVAKRWLVALEAKEAAEQRVAELEPKAEAFDGYIGAEGDYSANAAAKLLQRRGIDTGQNRLVALLLEWGWYYRGAKGKLRAKQAHIDCGRVAEKTSWYVDDTTGEKRAGDPQPRITPKGVDDIYKRLGAGLKAVTV